MKEFNNEKVYFISSSLVTNWVHCDVYEFSDCQEKDLWIIHIKDWYSTPLQEVLEWEKTIEGKISWAGSFFLVRDGKEQIFEISDNEPFEIEIYVWDILQIRANQWTDLQFYEICYPKYQDWRFKNLS